MAKDDDHDAWHLNRTPLMLHPLLPLENTTDTFVISVTKGATDPMVPFLTNKLLQGYVSGWTEAAVDVDMS
jgi:hypothetical protein